MSSISANILDLYHRSFPQSERRSDAAILSSIASPNYRLFTHTLAGTLTGFALLFVPASDAFALLEYLAVEPILRRQGLGARLVREALAAVPDRRVLFEVEAESLGETARRRQQFYRRCGCSKIEGLRYLLPLPNDPPPMELMTYPDMQILPATLLRWLQRIYVDVYRQPADDPRIQQMLKTIR